MYNSNIFIIKDKSSIIGIHEVDFDYSLKNYFVEVLAEDSGEQKQLYYEKLTQNTSIELDIQLKDVVINYYVQDAHLKDNGSVLYKSTSLNLYSFGRKRPSEEVISEQSLVDRVKYALDNPQGSHEETEHHTEMLKKSSYDHKARQYVEMKIAQLLKKEGLISEAEVESYKKSIYAEFYGMGVLQELDDDTEVSEIMVNAYVYPKFQCDIYYVKNGRGKKRYERTFENIDQVKNVFSRAISFSKKEMNNFENAIIEATRANGDRVNLVIPEASESYVLNIRKFTNFAPTKDNMKKVGTINDDIDELMDVLVNGKANIGIGGEMNTGKTSFINYLLSYTKPLDRKVIISSVKEVSVNEILPGHDIVFFKVDEDRKFSFTKLLKTALRSTADRIIVPESRGAEFKQVYEANLKTKGNMFTAHALTDNSFLSVCADMYMEGSPIGDIELVKNKVANSVDIIVIMKRVNNQIRIKSISEVLLDDNERFVGMNQLYYWDFGGKEGKTPGYRKTENKISDKLKQRLFEEGISYEILDRL